MKRLDKYLCEYKLGSRSEVKDIIRKGQVTINGTICKEPDFKIVESDNISVRGSEIKNQSFHYIMLYKPADVICARKDEKEKTVLDLIKEYPCRDLFPIGRLDKDTTGLLILTNDGALSHDLLSPKKHVEKEYEVYLEHELSDKDITLLENGISIGDEKPTLPSKISLISRDHIYLTIKEGRYHQIKRMMEAVQNKVIKLKRVRMSALKLDENLKPGEYRCLSQTELGLLCWKE